MESGGYWTDASSLDGISGCSDVEDSNSKPIKSALFSPTLSMYSVVSATSTPVNAPSSFSQQPKVAYLIGVSLAQNSELIQALQILQIEPTYVQEQDFSLSSVETSTSIFIFEEFAGSLFDSLRKKTSRLRIFGPPVVIDTSKSCCSGGEKTLPVTKSGYPIYTRLLRNCRISVTGIRSKDELYDIRRRILYMEGIFLEREGTLTHLIAGKCRGNKYRDAVALDKPILKPEWLDFLWKNKNDRRFDISKDMAKFKVRAFYGSKIALEGFDDTEKVGMIKLIEENEGLCVGATDPTVTHIVKGNSVTNLGNMHLLTSQLNEEDELTDVEDIRSPLKRARFELSVINDLNETDMGGKDLREHGTEKARILKAEWFWTSIQIEACADESAYQFDKEYGDDTLNNSIGTLNSFSSPLAPLSDTDGGTPTSSTPGSIGRRKRKRLINFMSPLSQGDRPRCIMEVDEDDENLDLGGKSLQPSQDDVSDAELASVLKRIALLVNPSDLKFMSSRHIEYLHLIETERNYVTILMNIIKLFKEPCEQEDQKAGRLLTPLEVKTIFNPILPIYSLHRRVLRDMLHLLENWTEDSLIGEIYVKYAQELRKGYEPYVEYFETIKNEIIRCETENPRFMAFLRIAQGKPQCGKQKLVELIIRPVQRLPSTALILKNLEKHTPKTNPDAEWITKGVEAIDRVNQTINQKKERADARVAMFDIFHEIEGCPVELISDHRSILKKYDVLSMNEAFGQKSELLTLCVFSDHFQVVKRRNLGGSKNMSSAMSMANLRSPAVSRKSFMHGPSSSYAQQKRYKFLDWINFCHVRKVVNILDMEPRSFAFVVREPDEIRERFLVFTIPEDLDLLKHEKISVVEFFAKQLAHSVDRVDYQTFVTTVDAATVRVHESSSVLEKAARFATKTKNKVGRALSLSRTPSKIKRTMSQMMSPFASRSVQKDPDSVSQSGSEASITPMRNNLSTMSLWFGSKRGTIDGQSTPKARKTMNEKDPRKGFSSIQET